MADETTNALGGESKKTGSAPGALPPQDPASVTIPEVRIIEETISRPAAKKPPAVPIVLAPAAVPTPPTAAPVPIVPDFAIPIPTPTPPPALTPPSPVPPAPVPVATLVPAEPLVVPTPPSAPAQVSNDPLADEVGLVLPHVQTPPPKGAAPSVMPSQEKPIDLSKPPEKAPALGEDIAKILEGVKLPERRNPGLATERRAPIELKTFDTTLGKSSTETIPAPTSASPLQETVANPAAVPSVVTPQQAEQGAGSVSAVHTLKNDLQDVVREKKISIVKAVSLEEERRARTSASPAPTEASKHRSKRTFGIMFSVLLLLGLGAAALFGVYTIMNQQKNAPPIETSSSILFAEASVLLSLDDQSPNDLKRALLNARTASQGTLGSITRIIPITAATNPDGSVQNRPTTFREFITAIGAHPPDDLLRALGDDFFLGLHTVDKNAPILIVPVTAHDRAFQAMLAWEETLNSDLSPAFTPLSILTTDKNGLPTKRTYEDLVMRNYDVRALKDDNGTIQLYYSFPTQNILVIAESPYSFTEILSRLQASRQL